jgi:hypothetical protein
MWLQGAFANWSHSELHNALVVSPQKSTLTASGEVGKATDGGYAPAGMSARAHRFSYPAGNSASSTSPPAARKRQHTSSSCSLQGGEDSSRPESAALEGAVDARQAPACSQSEAGTQGGAPGGEPPTDAPLRKRQLAFAGS